MIDFLLVVKKWREKSKGNSFAAKTICGVEDKYREILRIGMEANPPPLDHPGKKKRGRKKKSKPLNLLERL
jgi:hypothetical protein